MQLVDKEYVKKQLRLEQAAWEAEQGAVNPPRLHFWSVGKLLRMIQAFESDSDATNRLVETGIIRHSVTCVHPTPSTLQWPASTVSTRNAVTYSSPCVWLTGFLRFGTDVDTFDTLELCDHKSRLSSCLINPQPQVVDQLVLIKHWVLVNTAVGHERVAGSLFLEVHDANVIMLVPATALPVQWTHTEAVQVLETKFLRIDPPVYTGTKPWAVLARLQRETRAAKDVTARQYEPVSATTAPKRCVYAVYGRVTSVSPISRQSDVASSHFFVEIEHFDSCKDALTQSVANVMFTGVNQMRWTRFLRPGVSVLVTDLVKVRSRECNMLLLQTTQHHCGQGEPVDPERLETFVLIWPEAGPRREPSLKWLNSDSMGNTCTKAFASTCIGKLVDYTGQVRGLRYHECLELCGPDDARVIVCLFHFSCTNELTRLRQGATIHIVNAHVLLWPSLVGHHLVLGLCPRSHVVITRFGPPSGRCITPEVGLGRGRAVLKNGWIFRDFHRQSMVVSMWLLEMLDAMEHKFFFRGEHDTHPPVSALSFPHLRRRQAAMILAKNQCVAMTTEEAPATRTLGARFLTCHAPSAGQCTTVAVPLHTALVTCSRLVTIQELERLGKTKLKQDIQASSDRVRGVNTPHSIRLVDSDLDRCWLLGCIRGSIESGDLEVYDRTGAMAWDGHGGTLEVSQPSDRGLYVFKHYEIRIEDWNDSLDGQADDRVPLLYRLVCAREHVEYIALPDDRAVPVVVSTNGAEKEPVTLLVTRVDPIPRATIRSSAFLPAYRVIHGLVCPVGANLSIPAFLSSASRAVLLVRTLASSWFVQQGQCYRIHGVDPPRDAPQSRHGYARDDGAMDASSANWTHTVLATDRPVFCLKTLDKMRADKGDPHDSLVPIYRVEATQSIVPVTVQGQGALDAMCTTHGKCRKISRDASGLLVSPCARAHELMATPVVTPTVVHVTPTELVAMSLLSHCLRQQDTVAPVCQLLRYPLSHDAGTRRWHHPRLISVVGLIVKKRYTWQPRGRNQTARGSKRARDGTRRHASRYLQCTLTIRDLQHVDTVDVRVDASRFGLLGTLCPQRIVAFSRLQGYIARSSFKVFLTWSHVTATRLLSKDTDGSVPSDAELYGAMPTAFLNDLYHNPHIDKLVHRYVVGVVHISYVILTRKCCLCHQQLTFHKHCGIWQHGNDAPPCAALWDHYTSAEPAFHARTYVGTTVRCVVDDGSGQAELFLENDVAWELLPCSASQRHCFEDLLRRDVEDLRYFSGHTGNESLTRREQNGHEHALRALVERAIPLLRSIVVFAQEFYTATHATQGPAVLTCGKDIHFTTTAVPQPKLEAKRVDRLHVRSELHRRLATLRSRARP